MLRNPEPYLPGPAGKNSSAPKPTYKSAMKVVSLPFEGAPEGT